MRGNGKVVLMDAGDLGRAGLPVSDKDPCISEESSIVVTITSPARATKGCAVARVDAGDYQSHSIGKGHHAKV
jgi:hypothetical protein